MYRPVHFEIHATDTERAKAFYAGVLGWQFSRYENEAYWLIRTGEGQPGVDGGLTERRGPEPEEDGPVNGYVMIIDVEDIGRSAEAVDAAGGMQTVPTMTIPGVGWLGYFKDTEGNIFGLLQADKGAV